MPTLAISPATSADMSAIWVIVRDVVRKSRHVVPGTRAMLRVPYDLLRPQGPVLYRDEMITYSKGGETCLGRTAPAPLADARPGERVLLRLPPAQDEREWWLCEVEEVAP